MIAKISVYITISTLFARRLLIQLALVKNMHTNSVEIVISTINLVNVSLVSAKILRALFLDVNRISVSIFTVYWCCFQVQNPMNYINKYSPGRKYQLYA